MAHQRKKLDLPPMEGLSEKQISQHRDILYVGYLKNLNEIEDGLKTADRKDLDATYSPFGELKRQETFALNGVVLHEWYFQNLGGKGTKPGPRMMDLIQKQFGTYEGWLEEFKACATTARGWVMTCYSLYDHKLHNYCLDSHNGGVPVAMIPLLILDVYEHSYAIDYGVDRKAYLGAVIQHLNWDVVEKRTAILPTLHESGV
jgi:Fe-Mn family superoxide dismutase